MENPYGGDSSGLPDSRRLNTFLLGFLGLIGLVFVLVELYEVLLPLVLAMLLTILAKPLLTMLRRRRIPVGLCVVAVLLVVAAAITVVSLIVFSGVQAMVAEIPKYQESVNQIYKQGLEGAQALLAKWGRKTPLDDLTSSFELSSVTGFLASSAGSVLTFVLNIFLTLLFFIFLLLNSEDFPSKLHRAFSTEQSLKVSEILKQVDGRVRQYLITKTIINLIVAVLVTVILLMFGVEFALLTGILTFFLNYIPNFGAFVATGFPAVVSLLQFQSFGLTAVIVILLIVVHNIVGNFLEPKMLGRSLELSPLVVLISLIFWGWVWGGWGMVLATPITSIIKIICENVPSLQPIAVLISSSPGKEKEHNKGHVEV